MLSSQIGKPVLNHRPFKCKLVEVILMIVVVVIVAVVVILIRPNKVCINMHKCQSTIDSGSWVPQLSQPSIHRSIDILHFRYLDPKPGYCHASLICNRYRMLSKGCGCDDTTQ